MVPPEPGPDVVAALTAIIYQLQLIQRRLLRADGMSPLERELLLSTVADTLVTVHRLHELPTSRLAQNDPSTH